MTTKTKQLERGLIVLGYAEQPRKAGRVGREFRRPDSTPKQHIWLGKAGSLRVGPSKSNSLAASPRFLNEVLVAGAPKQVADADTAFDLSSLL